LLSGSRTPATPRFQVNPRATLLCTFVCAASILAACSRRDPEAKGTHAAGEPVRAPLRRPDEPLSAGDELPTVSAVAQTGARVTLGRRRDRPLLLFFCDSVRSERCRTLAQVLNARWSRLRAMNAEVVGVARDYRALLRAAAYDAKLPFYVLADPQGRIFGTFGLKRGGAVFVVSATGEIRERLTDAAASELGERAVQVVAELAHTSG
jgi:peroxiredoxin